MPGGREGGGGGGEGGETERAREKERHACNLQRWGLSNPGDGVRNAPGVRGNVFGIHARSIEAHVEIDLEIAGKPGRLRLLAAAAAWLMWRRTTTTRRRRRSVG